MFVDVPDLQAHAAALMAQQRYDETVSSLVVGVHNTYLSPQLSEGFLHYPGLDRCMEQLAQAVAQALPALQTPERPRSGTVVIATELFSVGGHARVVVDLLRELPEPTLVLTDTFGKYRREPDLLNWIHGHSGPAPVVVLMQSSPWAKCLELARLLRRLAPANIVYLQHHQDAVAFVGSLSDTASRKTLIHHCDHHPSLGGTLNGLHHVDFTDELAAVCTQALHRPAQVLPLHVADQGCKPFATPQGQRFSVVTSGSNIKFARTGPVALQAIAATVLSAIEGQFFHIGPLDDDWKAEIHRHLTGLGLDAQRFVPLGSVPSLWQTLHALDAHLYLGSAPAGGGRAAIEAQGCGYPLAFYRSSVMGSTTLRVDSVYASKSLGWATLDELDALLRRFSAEQPRLSVEARQLYENRYARAPFVRELMAMLGIDQNA